ncbi:MAG: hypothetical protein ACT4P3_13125 [Betaproteobacteria bacterium]
MRERAAAPRGARRGVGPRPPEAPGADRRRGAPLAVTGWSRESDRLLAGETGFAHYLKKPLSPDAVAELVATLPPVSAAAATPAPRPARARRSRR